MTPGRAEAPRVGGPGLVSLETMAGGIDLWEHREAWGEWRLEVSTESGWSRVPAQEVDGPGDWPPPLCRAGRWNCWLESVSSERLERGWGHVVIGV